MKHNTKKKAATAGTVALVAALMLTGTYAWNSISQMALNEDVTYSNPGGRLHDDWAGIANGTKNVYVENFTDNGGQAIFARVKLQTYVEYGEDAGKTKDENGKDLVNRKATSVVNGATIDNKETWSVYTFDNGAKDAEINDYLELEEGTKKTVAYMPTFNKSKESLMADINGTYEGTDAKDSAHFDDYVDYATAEQTKTANAYYYDENGTAADDGATAPGTDANYRTAQETHTVQNTMETAKIISMDTWLAYDGVTAGQEKTGNYWVYDEDGWFYWAQAIESQTATGPLITGVKALKENGEPCYYGINVVGEFASAGDWGNEAGKTDAELGFYKNKITDEAVELLDTLVAETSPYKVEIANTEDRVKPGEKLALKANVTTKNRAGADQEVVWSVSGSSDGATVITPGTNTLTVSANETVGKYITIIAKSVNDNKAVAKKRLRVTKSALPLDTLNTIDEVKVTEDGVLGKGGATKTVTIDNEEFYVLAKKDGKALLLAKTGTSLADFFDKTVDAKTANTNYNRWKDSTVRAYLNGTATPYTALNADGTVNTGLTYNTKEAGWLADKPTLVANAIQTEIKTLQEFDDDMTDAAKIDTTKDKIFLLSEADVYGTGGNATAASASFYTMSKKDGGVDKGVQLVAPNGVWRVNSRTWWWMRSASGNADKVAVVANNGTLLPLLANGNTVGRNVGLVRPACWIEY